MDTDYVCGSCGTPLSTLHSTVQCCVVLITECHNSHKHSQSPLTTYMHSLQLQQLWCKNIWLSPLLFVRWFPEVQNIFVLANKRKQVPSNHDAGKLQSFFNCAATLMTSHLQSLALVSMSDFTDLLCRPPVGWYSSIYNYRQSEPVWNLFF